MNTDTITRYNRERKLGFSAKCALQNAKTREKFKRYECAGLVRIRIEPDLERYDESYVDTWDCSSKKKDRIKKEIFAKLERDGAWGIIAEACVNERWMEMDSVWGFIGEEWRDSGYDVDLMMAAIDCIEDNYEI